MNNNREKEIFIDFLKEEIFEQGYDEYYSDKYGNSTWHTIKNFWEEFCKFQITEIGVKILNYMQTYCEQAHNNDYEFKAKEIADSLFVSTRVVSTAIHKLRRDGYIYIKQEGHLTKYLLTEKGKNYIIKDQNRSN